jgi:hypothetical protein
MMLGEEVEDHRLARAEAGSTVFVISKVHAAIAVIRFEIDLSDPNGARLADVDDHDAESVLGRWRLLRRGDEPRRVAVDLSRRVLEGELQAGLALFAVAPTLPESESPSICEAA